MIDKEFKLSATISSCNPAAIKPVLERLIGKTAFIKARVDGFEVVAEFKGSSARDLNRMFVSELRRAEKKTRIRSEWTCEGTAEKFFDYALRQTRRTATK